MLRITITAKMKLLTILIPLQFFLVSPSAAKDCSDSDLKNQIKCLTSEVERLGNELLRLSEESLTLVNMQNEVSELKENSKAVNLKLLNASLPRGSLVAFDRRSCPDGWEKFEHASGRVIVASGKGAKLTTRTLGETGGSEQHKLTTDEMPKHKHGGTLKSSGYSFEHHQSNGRLPGQHWDYKRDTSFSGKGAPHNNMQPFYVATLCRKT